MIYGLGLDLNDKEDLTLNQAQLLFKLEQDIKFYAPKLTMYQHRQGLIDTQLGKFEKLKRPLVNRITLMRAISHSTDKDKSPEADAYRAFVLNEGREAFERYAALLQEEKDYIEHMHQVNHDFVEDIISQNAPK